MRCDEALGYWQRELLGQPVDREKLEEAYAHIGACRDLCARALGAAPAFDLLTSPEQRAGQIDLYESLGLSAEEEGDAHARQWRRLTRLAAAGRANPEATEHERVMALASWQSAATYYHDGLRIGETAFLAQGLKRIKHKRLEPAAPAQGRARNSLRPRSERRAFKKVSDSPPEKEAPGGPSQPRASPLTCPTLVLVAHAPTSQITVVQHPAGWLAGSANVSARLTLRENSAPYSPAGRDNQQAKRPADLGQPQVDGMLDHFALAVWASELSQQWELELLVRAFSARQPWTSIVLTLEDCEQRWRKPTPMLFDQRAQQMTGWWARLRELATGDYHLRFSATDARGKSPEDATLGLRLTEQE